MNKVAVVYHSAHGHTQYIADKIAEGVTSVGDSIGVLLKAQELIDRPGTLVAYDGLIFGSPTYLGGVSGTFKTMMDATGGLWRSQQLQGKLAAGFTVSSLPCRGHCQRPARATRRCLSLRWRPAWQA